MLSEFRARGILAVIASLVSTRRQNPLDCPSLTARIPALPVLSLRPPHIIEAMRKKNQVARCPLSAQWGRLRAWSATSASRRLETSLADSNARATSFGDGTANWLKLTRTGRLALGRNQEFLTAVMMCAWILPVTGPGPNCLVIAAAAASVAFAKRSGPWASISFLIGVPWQYPIATDRALSARLSRATISVVTASNPAARSWASR